MWFWPLIILSIWHNIEHEAWSPLCSRHCEADYINASVWSIESNISLTHQVLCTASGWLNRETVIWDLTEEKDKRNKIQRQCSLPWCEQQLRSPNELNTHFMWPAGTNGMEPLTSALQKQLALKRTCWGFEEKEDKCHPFDCHCCCWSLRGASQSIIIWGAEESSTVIEIEKSYEHKLHLMWRLSLDKAKKSRAFWTLCCPWLHFRQKVSSTWHNCGMDLEWISLVCILTNTVHILQSCIYYIISLFSCFFSMLIG